MSRATRNEILLCLAILALALLLRGVALGEHGFWLDEASTLRATLAPDLAGLLDRVRDVEMGRTPLYYVMLRGWVSLTGLSEAAVRWPSAIFGALAAAAAFLLGRLLTRSTAAGALAGLVVALHPMMVGLSREARGYPLSHAFAFLGAALAVHAHAGGLPRGRELAARVAAALLGALAVTFHLFTGVFVVAFYLAFTLRGDGGRERRKVLVDLAVFGLFLLPQIPWFAAQAARHAELVTAGPALSIRDLGHYLLLAAGGKLAGPVLLLLGAIGVWRLARVRSREAWFVLALGGGALLLALLVHGCVRPVLTGHPRYLAWLSLPLALAIAALPPRKWWAPAIGAVLLAALGAGLFAAHREHRTYREDWPAVAALLAAEVRPGDQIICHAHYVREPLELYYEGEVRTEIVAPEEIEAPRSGGRTFLVWSHAGELADDLRSRLERRLGPSRVLYDHPVIRVLEFR